MWETGYWTGRSVFLSKSKFKLNESSTSKKSLDLNIKQQKRQQLIPPNPYHSSTNTAILVSAQDSEIQSLSSQPDDENNDQLSIKTIRKNIKK